MRKIIFLVVIAMSFSNVFAQSNQISSEDLKQLEGNWRGTLEYYDATKAKKNLVLKTELISEVKKGVLVMRFKYYDKNGEFTRKTEKLVILDNGKSIRDNVVWSVEGVTRDGEANIQLALQADAKEELKAMRKTITIKDGKLSISKDALSDAGNESTKLYSFNLKKLEHGLYR